MVHILSSIEVSQIPFAFDSIIIFYLQQISQGVTQAINVH